MDKKKYTDADLISSYIAGEKKALVVLVERWHKLFCDKAYWIVKDRDAAKDIAQDSWTTIINKIETLKKPSQFKYWAYRIVCNKSTDWLRLQAKKRINTINYEFEFKSSDDDYLEKDNLKVLLLETINKLPVNQRNVIRLFYIESYSLKDISSLLEISEGTAKSRLYHAREKLKTILKDRAYEN